ncbi:MAG: hypothetical protein K0Q73_6753 [Paenibacillus sp.]|jgi:hypothetical protein|nr:hypothetical protein [Paenibacillus sp.]
MITLGVLGGAGHVLSAVVGLSIVGFIGKVVIEELGWAKLGPLWTIAITIAGATITLKYAWDGIKENYEAVLHMW